MFFSKNIRFLRKQQTGESQGKLAKKLGITRSALSSYEEGRAEPKSDKFTHIANHFGVSLDQLFLVDLEKEGTENSVKQRNTDKYISAENLRILTISVDKSGEENVVLIPEKAAAGYTKGYSDAEYIKELDTYHLPHLPKGKTYRAFEITGDSMLPLQSGTIVIGEYMQDWKEVKDNQACVIVSQNEGIVFKKVFNRIERRNSLLLKSSNIHYAPYEISVTEVSEIWKFVAYIGQELPQAQSSMDDLKVAFHRLEDDFYNFKMEVGQA